MVAIATVTACSDATDGGDATATPAPADATNASTETLYAQPPSGWVEGLATATAALRRVEYHPEPNPHSERVVFESYPAPDLPDPIQFLETLVSEGKDRCAPHEDVNVSSGYENNYATSVRLMICHQSKATGKGKVTMAKAIRGNDYFYSIVRERGFDVADDLTGDPAGSPSGDPNGDPGNGAPPLSPKETAVWAAYLRGIHVCDSERSEHPCKSQDPPS